MARKRFEIKGVTSVPTFLNPGYWSIVQKGNRHEIWIGDPRGIPIFNKGITDDEQSRINKLNIDEISKLIGLPTIIELDKKFDNLNLGVLGVITTSQNLTQLNSLENGIYEAQTSGAYANGLTAKSGYYTKFKKVGTVWTLASEVQMPSADLSDVAKVNIISGKNKININSIDFTKKYSPGTLSLATRDGIAAVSAFIPVVGGNTYTISSATLPNGVAHSGGYFLNSSTSNAISNITFVNTEGGYKFTVPNGQAITGIRVNIMCNGNPPNNTPIGFYQLELGDKATSYEAYSEYKVIKDEFLPEYLKDDQVANKSEVVVKVNSNDLFNLISFNKINPLDIDFNRQYSPTLPGLRTRDSRYCVTAFIPVEESKYYTISCTEPLPEGFSYFGGYFESEDETTALSNITFNDPVIGIGKNFQVPQGLNIKGVRIDLICQGLPPNNLLIGDYQLEEGEMATSYKPYEAKAVIKESLLPENNGGGNPTPSTSFDDAAWYKYTQGEDKSELLKEKAPIFLKHYLLKNKNLRVVNTGTSLTARTTEHCTEHPKANERPPLMDSNNIASILWDKMKWDNQFYRRYDYPDMYVETGVFNTNNALSEWDDGPYRNSLTRYSETLNAKVSFKIPINAWQFNFIYRTDSIGVTEAKVTILEGNGFAQILDPSDNVWKEANNFIFSMRESTPITRVVQVPSPNTGNLNNITLSSKSNTTYQKRLHMRCKNDTIDSRNVIKNVSIEAQTSGRFMYWGTEWSNREFMITYINSARGSHATDAASVRGLPRFADNEIWGFKPDLMFFELPIHNDGASNELPAAGGAWWRLTNNFIFNPTYELSMVRRSQDLNGYVPEMIMHTMTISYGFEGINEDGTLKLGLQGDGSMMSAVDKFYQAYQWVIENHPEIGAINSIRRWIEAGEAIFGDMKSATVGSDKGGKTFTKEGSHLNDTGSKIIAKTLTGVFNII